MRMDFRFLQVSLDNLINTKANMLRELNNLDTEMNALQSVANVRLREGYQAFVVLKSKIVKEFEELDRLKAELDDALEGYWAAEQFF